MVGFFHSDRLLEQARIEVAGYEKLIKDIEDRIGEEKRKAKERLDSDYAAMMPAKSREKDIFETTAEYRKRIEDQAAVASERGHKKAGEVVALEDRYGKEALEQTAELRGEIAMLKQLKYPMLGVKLAFDTYDADQQLLVLKLRDGHKYCAQVEPTLARAIRDQVNLLTFVGTQTWKPEEYLSKFF